MAQIDNWDTDGTISVLGGINSAETPDLIEQNELAWAVNAELRGGKPHTRGAWVERLTLPFGLVQGMDAFTLDMGMIIVSISGRLYRITANGLNVSFDEINVSGQRSQKTEKVWMEKTTEFLVIQDGISNPLIYDGVSARESRADEVPLGRQMAFGNGRLWVAIQGNKLAAGDITKLPGSELKFTETNTLFQGGTFLMGGIVKAMKFMPSNDTTTGLGALIVGGEGFSSAVRADIPDRNQWLSTPGFITTIPGLGFIGQPSVVTHDQDMYMRDDDGKIRNLRQAVADWQDAGSTSISQNIRRITDHEEIQFLENCPAIVVDGRMISGASPFMVYQGCLAFRDMVSYDFSPSSKPSLKTAPIFDGEWEGIFVTHMSVMNDRSKKRGFAIGKDFDGNNRLYEYMPELQKDQFIDPRIEDGAVSISPIQWQVYYKAFTFKSPLTKKKYRRTDIFLSEIQGDVTVEMYFRTGCDPKWHLIEKIKRCANKIDECNADKRAFIDFEPGCSDILTHEPEDPEGEQYVGFSFQIRLVITGVCQVDQLLVFAERLPTPQNAQEDPVNDPEKCQFNEVNFIASEYLIPTIRKSLDTYIDELGDAYEDEDAQEYIG